LFNLAQNVSGLPGFWDADLTLQSHGEGFLTVLEVMFAEPGIYLMDEPVAALSFTSCLGLVSLLDRLAATGGQVICATHSPLLTALPGAQIFELGAHGIRPVAWTQLQFVDHWRRYLANPASTCDTSSTRNSRDQHLPLAAALTRRPGTQHRITPTARAPRLSWKQLLPAAGRLEELLSASNADHHVVVTNRAPRANANRRQGRPRDQGQTRLATVQIRG
jgi:hypothetical protein